MLEVQVVDQFISLSEEQPYYDLSFAQIVPSLYVVALGKTVRVIIGELGAAVRMSAPELDIVIEGSSREQAWEKFLKEINKRFEPDDSCWLSFDVGPTRREEIAEGLNAPEDEDWSEPVKNPKE